MFAAGGSESWFGIRIPAMKGENTIQDTDGSFDFTGMGSGG